MNSELLQAGLPPANDRMVTTCFLAALIHGIVILGVTFSASKGDDGGSESPALEILLVNEKAPGSAANPDARYLAQRNQSGSGNLSRDERTLIPDSAQAVDPVESPGTGAAALHGDGATGADELVSTLAPLAKIQYLAPPTADQQPSALPEVQQLQKPDLEMAPNDDGIELRVRGAPRPLAWIAADTRESDLAVYLDGWRRKVERMGTMNFPDVALRRKLSGTPVIEVTIGADGRLLKTWVRRSSGHLEIDAAAMRILKLAAPYDPFPRAMSIKHDEIRIAYEWQFLGAGGPDLSAPRP